MTSLAWKGDFLVFGDAEGIQCLWDLKAKISRSVGLCAIQAQFGMVNSQLDYFTFAFLGGPEGPFVMSPALLGLLVFASACLVSHKGKVSDHTSIVVLLITDYPEER